MSVAEVLVQHDSAALADAIAARLVTTVVEAQSARGSADVCLTGGRIGTACLAALAARPSRDSIDWDALDIWWGDERFLASGDPGRNETGARAALLDAVPISPERIHAMPAAAVGDDGTLSTDVEAAARTYSALLATRARPEDHAKVPSFDVCLLGIGEDAHVASLFPQSPAMHDERWVVGVRTAPKPPPLRVSLTLRAINASRQVWILGSGQVKAEPVRLALSQAGPLQVPASGVRGRERTYFLLDSAAASALPPELRRLASP